MFKAGDTIKIENEFVLKRACEGWFEIGGVVFCEKELLALGAVKVRKHSTLEDLCEKLVNLDIDSFRLLKFRALGLMKESNSGTKIDCIYTAMGYTRDDNGWYKVGEE